ncbi:60S ribosomal protein L17 [Aspergillus lentulus]|nr:60S ribosomal protein L17 [Aspergillus lentulus]
MFLSAGRVRARLGRAGAKSEKAHYNERASRSQDSSGRPKQSDKTSHPTSRTTPLGNRIKMVSVFDIIQDDGNDGEGMDRKGGKMVDGKS